MLCPEKEELFSDPIIMFGLTFRTIVATSGSDYKPFYHTIGISCVDLRYMFAKVFNTISEYSSLNNALT